MNIENNMLSVANIFDSNQSNTVSETKGEKIKDVAANFASIFINEILQSSRKANFSKNSLFDSDQIGMSQKLYYQQISNTIAHEPNFGVTKMIEKELESGNKHNE